MPSEYSECHSLDQAVIIAFKTEILPISGADLHVK